MLNLGSIFHCKLSMRALSSLCLVAVSAVIVSCGTPARSIDPMAPSPMDPIVQKPINDQFEFKPKPAFQYPRGVDGVPYTKSPSVIVFDPRSQQVIYERNAHEKRAVASTQKLLTALVARAKNPTDRYIEVPYEATLLEPSKLYVKSGARYPLYYLLKSLVVKSANDVAHTIAHGVSGSKNAFVNDMNQYARQIGMRNSHFKNPHGLTESGQYSTAYDVALLASAAYRDPYIRQCVKTREMDFVHNDGRAVNFKNTNLLLHRIPYCVGMKTGTTKASGKCLASIGTLAGQTRIVVVLGASTRQQLFDESEALLRWSLEG